MCVIILSIATLNLPHGEVLFLLVCTCMIIVEILPICYYGDQFLDFSRKLADGAYGTDWVYQNRNFRIAILLIIRKSQNPDPILAGGIIPISMPTFLSVSKHAQKKQFGNYNILHFTGGTPRLFSFSSFEAVLITTNLRAFILYIYTYKKVNYNTVGVVCNNLTLLTCSYRIS